jgi:WD40 repeat protein
MIHVRSAILAMRCSILLNLGIFCLIAVAAAARGDDAKTPRTDLYGDPLPSGAVMRLGTIRLRHANADLAFSADGKQLISCGSDGELRFWDVATGKLLQRKQLGGTPLKRELENATLSANGARAAFRSRFGTVRVYDTKTGQEIGQPRDKERCVGLLGVSPNGEVLALRNDDGLDEFVVEVLASADRYKCGRILGQMVSHSIAFTPDGKWLAAIGSDEKLRIWDTASGMEISKSKSKARIDLIEGPQPTLAFSPNGKLLAAAFDASGKVELRDGTTLKTIGERRMPAYLNNASIEALTFSPDSSLLVGSFHADGVAGVAAWDMKDEKRARRLASGGCIEHFAFSPDGRTLAGLDAIDSEIRLWEMPSDRPLLRRPAHNAPGKVLAVSPDGRTIVSADSEPVLRPGDVSTLSNEHQPTLHLWDAASGKLLHALDGNDWIIACLFSPDGKQVISASKLGTVEVWDAATGKKQRRFNLEASEGNSITLHTVAISADGKRLSAVASVGQIGREQLFVYDLATGKQRARHPCQGLQIESRLRTVHNVRVFVVHLHTTFTPDGECVSVHRDGRTGFEDITTRCSQTTLPKDVGAPLVFSPDGRLVAAIVRSKNQEDESRSLCLIETTSGEEVVRLEKQVFEQTAFTPDGRALVMAGRKALRVWDTDTGALVHEMVWPESIRDVHDEVEISSLAVLPSGRVVTGMREGEILMWDLCPSTWPVPKARADLSTKEIEALWSSLAGEASSAHRAISQLSAAPGPTVSWMNEHLHPVAVDGKRIDKLFADLEGDSFEVREVASEKLARMRYRAEPMLRRALEGKPSLELRRRIEAILAEPRPQPIEVLRTLRAIAVLERIGTPEARRVLEKVAAGAEAPETSAAQQALKRLKYR